MSSMLDIIFSVVLGFAITLIVINANATMREAWSVYNGDVMVQTSLISNAQIIESEFRNMGCGMSDASQTIRLAKDTAIAFCVKLRPNSLDTDTIKYYSGAVGEYVGSTNPDDRYLYRQVNNNSPDRVGIITQFTLRYFKQNGDFMPQPIATANLFNIKIVEVTMFVQSANALFRNVKDVKAGQQNALYSTGMWRQTRLASQNLKR